MPIEQQGNALVFYAFFTESKVGKAGLAVTADVYRNGVSVVSGGAATEVGGGLYRYTLAAGSNNAEGEYVAILKTATTSVDQQHVPSLWVVDKAGVENLNASSGAIKAKTDLIPAAPAAAGDVTAVGAAILEALPGEAPTANQNAAAVWADAAAAELIGSVARILGLTQDNWVLTSPAYDGDGNLTEATIRVYDSAANADEDDGVTGLLYSYAITNTYANGLLAKSTQARLS